jgi:hypothetical protein
MEGMNRDMQSILERTRALQQIWASKRDAASDHDEHPLTRRLRDACAVEHDGLEDDDARHLTRESVLLRLNVERQIHEYDERLHSAKGARRH